MRKVDEKKAQLLLNEPISKIIPQMAFPTIIAQLITVIYNLTDTFFVSQIGTTATAAVGVNNSLEITINTVAMLVGGGASSYIARLLGAREKDHADRVFSTSLAICVCFGVIFAVICLSMLENVVNLLGANDSCRQYAMEYGSFVLLAAPFMVVSYMLNQCLRSEGSATLAMVGIGFGGILNCFLDPVFIFWMGLGVKGASMATAISKVVSCCILVYPYVMHKSVVSPSIRKVKFDLGDIREVVSIGMTGFIRSATSVLASTLMNRSASAVSTSMLAAISVSTRVMQFPFNIILGFGAGFQPVAGYNWGARRYDRVKNALQYSIKVSLMGGVIMGAIGFALAPQIIGLFNSSADAEVLAMGTICIRLQCLVLLFHAYLSIINMFYAGIGKPRQAMALSLARQGYCFLIALFTVPAIFGSIGLAGVQATADLLSLIVTIPLGFMAFNILKKKYLEEEPIGETQAAH